MNIFSFNSRDLSLVLILNQTELGVKVGNSYQLEPTIFTNNVYHGEIEWSSSDESIVTINETTGYINTHGIGDVTIKAKITSAKDTVFVIVN